MSDHITVDLTHEDAEEFLEACAASYSEGQGWGPDWLVRRIWRQWPDLQNKFEWLPVNT
jgi:hypothetical protein